MPPYNHSHLVMVLLEFLFPIFSQLLLNIQALLNILSSHSYVPQIPNKLFLYISSTVSESRNSSPILYVTFSMCLSCPKTVRGYSKICFFFHFVLLCSERLHAVVVEVVELILTT